MDRLKFFTRNLSAAVDWSNEDFTDQAEPVLIWSPDHDTTVNTSSICEGYERT